MLKYYHCGLQLTFVQLLLSTKLVLLSLNWALVVQSFIPSFIMYMVWWHGIVHMHMRCLLSHRKAWAKFGVVTGCPWFAWHLFWHCLHRCYGSLSLSTSLLFVAELLVAMLFQIPSDSLWFLCSCWSRLHTSVPTFVPTFVPTSQHLNPCYSAPGLHDPNTSAAASVHDPSVGRAPGRCAVPWGVPLSWSWEDTTVLGMVSPWRDQLRDQLIVVENRRWIRCS